jgi:SAM-dependent methyltransferase
MPPTWDLQGQIRHWDRLADDKHFSHPLCREWLERYIGRQSRILDLGCGYGRILGELVDAGYEDVIGADFSFRMLERSRSRLPGLRLLQSDGRAIPLREHFVDLTILFAVLTCLPSDDDQRALLHEIERVIRPGGFLYISDLLINDDPRNRERYECYKEECGIYGIFRLPDGLVVRHHRKEWIEELTSRFRLLEYEPFEVTTMNGNRSAAFQYLGQAPGTRSK